MTVRYRVCAEPGCPNFTEGHTRCDDCRSAHERARGTRQQRGYDSAHDKQRATIQGRIDAGHSVYCWRCGTKLEGRAWHLDHNDDRTGYRGPACITCNTSLGGQARHHTPRG